MADLRKANKLWPSDPIHLRKVLYIPVHKALRAKEFLVDSNLISMSTPDFEPLDPFRSAQAEESEPAASLSTLGPIRRVPTAHMSFFPPPAHPQSKHSDDSSSTQLRDEAINGLSNGHLRYATTPSHSLTSILTALPIAASTRDTIIARLSFESTSSSYTDHSRCETYQEGHELDHVKYIERPVSNTNTPDHRDSAQASLKSGTKSTPLATKYVPSPPNSSLPSSSRQRHPRNSSSPPASYIPRQTHIRTVQLEPSPVMQLPTIRVDRSRLETRARRRPPGNDAEIELRGTRAES